MTSEVAVMHALGGTVLAGQKDLESDRNSIQTLVATKRENDWRITAFQNTRVNYMGRPEANAQLTEELRGLL